MEPATQKPTDNPAMRQLSMISMFSIANKNARKNNKIAATWNQQHSPCIL